MLLAFIVPGSEKAGGATLIGAGGRLFIARRLSVPGVVALSTSCTAPRSTIPQKRGGNVWLSSVLVALAPSLLVTVDRPLVPLLLLLAAEGGAGWGGAAGAMVGSWMVGHGRGAVGSRGSAGESI
jgi:hypothetical protein